MMKEEGAVAAAVEVLRHAMLNVDQQALKDITADSLSYGHSGGKIQDKAAFINTIVTGGSVFESIGITDQTIQITGNTAVVRHILTAHTKDKGKPADIKLHILHVWHKEGNNWKLLARQAYKTGV